MENNSPIHSETIPVLRTFGVGDTGIKTIELMIADGLMSERFVAVNSDAESLEKSAAGEKILLEDRRLRGLGSGGDPERARRAAEIKADQFNTLCEGIDVVFIVAGLGGGSGTGISPVVARIAKAAGATVLAFVTNPFDCEGDQRQFLAQRGLDDLKEIADGVVCLPNQKVYSLIEQNTSAVDTFNIINRFLADGVQGVWRLLALKGLIQIHPEALLRLLHDRHGECAFAVAQASGPDRAPRVVDKLLAHPMLDNGQAIANSDSVLIALTAGPQLTMAEVRSVMEQIRAQCHSAQVLMGAAIDERFEDRLAVTVIAMQKLQAPVARDTQTLDTQLLERTPTAKPNSRFLPPAPALAPEKMRQMFARQNGDRSAQRRASLKMRQAQLPLEIVSKGRFDKSEPTIHKGEDLDVPTYIRRGVPLN